MTFEEEFDELFPSLKGTEALVNTNPLFPEYMIRSGDIRECCVDKQRLKELLKLKTNLQILEELGL